MDWSYSKFTLDGCKRSIEGIRFFTDAFDVDYDHHENELYSVTQTDGCCPYCGVELYAIHNGIPVFSRYSWDHMLPAARFGLRTLGNMTLSCSTCNNEKGALSPFEYWQQRHRMKQPLWVERKDEFVAFVDNYGSPYRNKFPDHYKVAREYLPYVTDDNKVLREMFLSPYNGNPYIELRDRWRSAILPNNSLVVLANETEWAQSCNAVTPMLEEIVSDWDAEFEKSMQDGCKEELYEFYMRYLLKYAGQKDTVTYDAVWGALKALSDVAKRKAVTDAVTPLPSYRACQQEILTRALAPKQALVDNLNEEPDAI